MINAYSTEHHQYIDASLWFNKDSSFGTLILHNENGVYVQVRLYQGCWASVCRGCGKLGNSYDCVQCIAKAIAAMMPGIQAHWRYKFAVGFATDRDVIYA